MKFRLLSICVVFSIMFSAYSAFGEDWRKNYPKVTFGLASGENQQDTITRWQPAADYMSEQMGVKVVIRTASDYAGIIEAMAAGKVEFAWLGGSGYATAYDVTGGNVEALLMDVSSKGKLGYHSVIVVKGDAPFNSLEDLKGRSLAFADPNSTSGYMIPKTILSKKGYMDRNKPFFSRTGFSGSHENGVIAVVNNTYDAAATWAYDKEEGNHSHMISKGMIKPGDIKIIWWSPLIPNSPFCALKSLPGEMKQAFKTALLNFEKNDPARFKKVVSGMLGGFAEADHDMYQYAIDIRQTQKRERK